MAKRYWSRWFGWAACLSLFCTLTAWFRLDKTSAGSREQLIHPYADWDLDRREPASSDGQTCLLPRVHPFDPSILPYLGTPKPIVCKIRQYPLTLVDDSGRLMFNSSALTESGYDPSRLNCQYCPLYRLEGDDFHVGYGLWKSLGRHGVLLTSDFVAVACYNFLGLTVYDYMHAHAVKVPPRFPDTHRNSLIESPIEEQLSSFNLSVGNDFYSVFVFGVDSLSRLSFIRQLPKTYHYLTENMSSFVFRGMTKVGDNTFPNLAAVLTGKPLEELPLKDRNKSFDDWPCLWKDFRQRSFATMYAEDQPHIGLFNYYRDGLRSQPTDHYMRPYWLAVEASTLHRLSSNMCFGGTPKHLLQLRYARSFVRAYRDRPSFGFSFLVELSHDYISKVTVADQDFESWLRDLHMSGHFKRTVFIFLSDHGHRFDAMRATLIGRIEERMPFVAMYLPPALLEAQPHVATNLQLNMARLTSLYDVHATLTDILELSQGGHKLGRTKTGKGVSLFGSVPLNRTCQEAGISEHYCICEEEAPLPTDDTLALSAAGSVVLLLNDMLRDNNASDLCAELRLKHIDRVDMVKPSRDVQVNSRIYFGKHVEDTTAEGMMLTLRVQIRTEPSNAVFEATIQYRVDENNFTVLKDVSRINLYGDQSWCVSNVEIKKFCYCVHSKPKR